MIETRLCGIADIGFIKRINNQIRVYNEIVYAKIARGEMVRFMAGIHAETPEQMKDFNWSGYHFDDDRSSDQEYIFIRITIPGKGSLSL